MTESAALLHCEDVTVTYRRRSVWRRDGANAAPALRNLSIRIAPGETWALVGESGSGKSTLIRAVQGLLPLQAGHITFDGADISRPVGRRNGDVLRRIQIVFQNPDASLNPRATVGSIIGRPLQVFHGLDRRARERRAGELLTAVQLDAQFLRRRPRQLSGGERQRVAIARALAAESDLILCDEILSALDASVQAGVIALLKKLQRERGVTYLFVSHDLSVVRWLAHRVGVLYRGVLCESGPTAAVFQPPFHPYTELLLRAIPRPNATEAPAAMPSQDETNGAADTACPFFARCAHRIAGLCDRQPPPLQTASAGHEIRCHLTPSELADRQAGWAASLRPAAAINQESSA